MDRMHLMYLVLTAVVGEQGGTISLTREELTEAVQHTAGLQIDQSEEGHVEISLVHRGIPATQH